jgi:NitT/TauT family transport system substrate-binding protein
VLALAGLAVTLGGRPSTGRADYIDQYGLRATSPELDVGVQPLGLPTGLISAALQRDRTLQSTLRALDAPLRTFAFRRGADMLPLLSDQRLEAGLLGDMPTLVAAARGDVWVAGLVKQTTTALVARRDLLISKMAGKRIAYVEASSAHLTVLQGLTAAGLSERQVTLVPMGVGEMPAALQAGSVDAIAAWEPFTTMALHSDPRSQVVFRGTSSDYFVIGKAFARKSPLAAMQLIAGFVRSILWMRESRANLEQAAQWALAEIAKFGSDRSPVTVAQAVAIARRELLDVPSAPALLDDGGPPRLKAEFEFLKGLGKLDAGADWAKVDAALAYDGLPSVLGDPRLYKLRQFDYLS